MVNDFDIGTECTLNGKKGLFLNEDETELFLHALNYVKEDVEKISTPKAEVI